MTERGKRDGVIKALECAIDKNHFGFKHCHNCEYRKDVDHLQYVCDGDRCIADAIDLLKKSFTPKEVYDTVIVHAQHDKRFKLGNIIDYSFEDVVDILNCELMCKAGDM